MKHRYLLTVVDFEKDDWGNEPYWYKVGDYATQGEMNEALEKEKAYLFEKYGVEPIRPHSDVYKDEEGLEMFMIIQNCVPFHEGEE